MEETSSHRLNQLPPEVLDLLLGSKRSSHLVLRLWTCGNSLLNSKLATGITYVNLKASWSLQIGFPSVLLKLRALRYLSLTFAGSIMKNPLEWKGVVLSLPSTLETLKIVSKDCELAFRNFAPDWTKTAPTYIETDYPQGKSTFINLAPHMPHLTKLKINGKKNVCTVPFYARDLPALPPTITDLCILLQRYGHPQMMSLLPRSLLRLHAGPVGPADAAGIADWLDAPPNLEHVDVIKYTYPQSDFSWIPRSLRHVNVEKAGFGTFSFNDAFHRDFPVNYESLVTNVSLQMGHQDASGSVWASLLSPRLTALKVSSARFSTSEIPFLPKLLTSLTIDTKDMDWNHFPSTNDWPPLLHTLSLLTANIDSMRLDFLPGTLTDLSICYDDSGSEINFLPSSLTSLRISLRTRNVISFNGPLPYKLKTLALSSRVAARPDYDVGIHFKSPPQDPKLALPPSLTHLAASLEPAHRHWISYRDITTLVVGQWRFDKFSVFPSSLTSLTVHRVTTPPSGEPACHLTESLPPSLTILHLEPYVESLIDPILGTAESFSNLPLLRSLCAGCFIAPSAVLKNLPRTLQVLKMRFSKLEEVDMPFIPQMLEEFSPGRQTDLSNPKLGQYWPIAANKELPTEQLFAAVNQRIFDHGSF